MPIGVGDDGAHDVEAVLAAGERKARFGGVFRRQLGHGLGVHIGRVRKDEVEALLAERREEIAAMERDAVLETVIGDIALGDLERIGGNVRSVNVGVGKARGENGEAPRARAKVENGSDPFGVLRKGRANVPASNSPIKERGTITRSSTKKGSPWI